MVNKTVITPDDLDNSTIVAVSNKVTASATGVASAIAANATAQSTLANAIKDDVASAIAGDSASMAAFVAGFPAASTSTEGKVELATSTEAAGGSDASRALTSAALAAAMNDTATAGGNAMQDAVVNAVQAAIGSDAGATQAIAAAIAGDATAQASIAASIIDDLPDTAKTVRGFVNLVDLQQMGDGRKVFDAGVHVGSGNPANPNRANCTAIGPGAGANNTGANQTATGYAAGFSNTGGFQTATGFNAGFNNTGAQQTATGNAAGYNNTGYAQTATGIAAGYNNTGADQTATGREAGYNNTGAQQTATGLYAGYNNTGANNSFYGYESGTQTGTLIGTVTMTPSSASAGTVSPALPSSVVGKSLPVFISSYDWRVLTFTSTTAYTMVGGPSSGTWTASVYEGLAFNNVTALGYDAEPTASNQVMLGNGAVTEVRTAGTYFGAGFTTVSDATLKENVKDIDPAKALAFRNGLKWKRFEVFAETQSEIKETQTFERDEEYTDSEGKPATRKVSVTVQVPTGAYKVTRTSQGVQYGLIAQDVQKLAAEVGDFADVVINLGEYFELDADGFPKKDKQGNPIKHMRLGLNYDAINVIVMAGEQAALLG